MRKGIYLILLLLLLAGAFLGGTRYNRSTVAQPDSAGSRVILYYVDPMHPAYKSDQPGIAPDCGMDLVPVFADARSGDTGESSAAGLPGTVKISPEKQQLMGVQVSRVEKLSSSRTLRLFGRVAPDEARIYKLNAGIDGFIQEVAAATTGSQVKKDELLATFSAPNATSAIQTYILNVGAEQRFSKAVAEGSVEGQALPAANWNVQQRTQQLQNLGISLAQMEEIKRTRKIPERLHILAPSDGFVLARNVFAGQRFERGAEWYLIADLTRVWILAEVFESEAQYIRPGLRVLVSLPNQQRKLTGRVSEVLPQFDPATRTLKVRLEVDNPGFVLRPDMFVDVELPIASPPAIAVPLDAVVDSGLTKTVFVERSAGVFEPRQVETGWHSEDRVEIVQGLAPGERIAVAGNFLIGSESRLQAAAAKDDHPRAVDPSCGMEVQTARAREAGRTSAYRGQTYFFCSDSCKQKFDKDPALLLQPRDRPRLASLPVATAARSGH